MTRWISCAVLLAFPFLGGCSGLYRMGTRNLANEAALMRDDKLETIRNRHLAEQAWKRVQSCTAKAYSADYVKGFKAGFVDYLFAGGCGEPPALPPKHYRHFLAESPEGAEALQDWYAGFRHGAAEARDSGLRRFVVLSLPPPADGPPEPTVPPEPLVPPPAPLAKTPMDNLPPGPPLPPIGGIPDDKLPPMAPSPLPMPRPMPAHAPHGVDLNGTPKYPAFADPEGQP